MSDKNETNSSEISWYSIDANLKTQENGVVSLAQAISIVNRHFTELKPHYETSEQALAATMFGFCRTKDTFIEICIHSFSEISFKYEMLNADTAWYLKLFKGIEQFEEILKSREALIDRVEKFFTNLPKDYYQILKNKSV